MVDLRGLGFVDSSGLRLFIVLADRAREEGWALVLVPPGEAVLAVFQISAPRRTCRSSTILRRERSGRGELAGRGFAAPPTRARRQRAGPRARRRRRAADGARARRLARAVRRAARLGGRQQRRPPLGRARNAPICSRRHGHGPRRSGRRHRRRRWLHAAPARPRAPAATATGSTCSRKRRTRWGVESTADTTVWFELAREG